MSVLFFFASLFFFFMQKTAYEMRISDWSSYVCSSDLIELKTIQRRSGTTFVFVTHDQEEALTMSDRIAVMNKGRVEQLGAPEAVYHYPETHFDAHFVGEMNFLPGNVVASDETGRGSGRERVGQYV